jgi:hypothetical protein
MFQVTMKSENFSLAFNTPFENFEDALGNYRAASIHGCKCQITEGEYIIQQKDGFAFDAKPFVTLPLTRK